MNNWINLHNYYITTSIVGIDYSLKYILDWIEKLISNQSVLQTRFKINTFGRYYSENNQEIPYFTIGKGSTYVLLWARMHGNEPTATKSLLDISNLLLYPKEDLVEKVDFLLTNLTLVFIPVLNPDGFVNNSRYNALGIDINRDATQLVSKEAKLLSLLQKKIQPKLAFNLHDQKPYYAAGSTGEAVAIALLAPPTQIIDQYSYNRKIASQLITSVLPELKKLLPNKIGRWASDYEPRAFGEYMQTKGVATILIESGFILEDLGKEVQRKYNFSIIMSILMRYCENNYHNIDIQPYLDLPLNSEIYFDFLIKNIVISPSKKIDLALNCNHQQYFPKKKFIGQVTLEDIGDLSRTNKGHITIDGGSLFYENNIRFFQNIERNVRCFFNLNTLELKVMDKNS